MKRVTALRHEFVEFIPDKLEDGIVYVSIPYATVAHKCCCGCGVEVVTPLSPTDWKLIFDGESISLDPSIGNWSFPCKSHYWIRHNRIRWAERWSREKIVAVRAYDRSVKQGYLEDAAFATMFKEHASSTQSNRSEKSLWQRLRQWTGWS
jgi:hypothetical protein